MQSKIAKAVAYTLFFLTCLVYFTIQGFPIQVIQGRIEREAQRALGMKMTTGSLQTLFPNGVEAQGIRLMKEGREGEPGMAILVDRLKARISLLGLLTGQRDISFDAELMSGKIEGELSLAGATRKVDLAVHALDLSRLPIWQGLIGLPVTGKISGQVDLNVSPQDFKATSGTIQLALEQGSLGEGKLRGLTLPPIRLGKTEASLEIAKGKAEIKTFSVRSDDIEASLEGYFLLQKKLSNLSARCKVRFKPSDDFLNRNAKFKDLIQLSGLNRAKGKDGFFGYTVYGRLDQPQFRPLR